MAKRFGVMLDCSRNAVMKVEKVKEFVLMLKKMGYNTFMLYTEDTYEIKGEPYFGYLRGRYSAKELKGIDSFCVENGVELIPCIQTLAHLNQALKYWFYADVKDCFDVLLVDEEKTYALIDKMFATIAEVFTSKKVHIGMDEAVFVGLGNFLKKHGYENRFDILRRHLEKVVAICKKYGFEPIMWSDMFFRLANGGDYYPENPIFCEDAVKSIPDGVSLCYWDYYHKDKDYYSKMIRAHKAAGKDVWFAGGAWKWVGFAPCNKMTIETMLPALTACREEQVENVIITLWGDDGNECQPYSVLPSLVYVAEIFKGNTDVLKIKERFNEIVGEDYDEFMALDMPVNGFNKDETYVNGSKTMLYSDPFLGVFDVFVSGGEGDAFLKIAEQMSTYKAKNGKYRLTFECAESFARLVSKKYELGCETRRLYALKDKEGLIKLLAKYDNVASGIDDLLEKFEKLWFDTNKPNGFETHELRLGGLKTRIIGCRKRLCKYINGELDAIGELEESLVDEGKKKLPFLSRYSDIATVNIL